MIDRNLLAFFYLHIFNFSCSNYLIFFFFFIMFFFFFFFFLQIRYVIYVWIFNLISVINKSAFMTISCCFYYYSSVVQLETSNHEASNSSLSFRVVLAILFFSYEVENFPFRSVKNYVGILMGFALNL